MRHLANFESYNESKSDMKKIKKEIKDKMSEIEKLELKHSDMKKPSAQGSVLKQQISKLKTEVKSLEKELNTSEDFSYEAEMEEEDPYQDGFDAAQEYNVRGVFTKNPYERGSEEHAQWERGHYDGSQQPKQEFKRIS
jgi:hypothetical protein